MTELKPCPICGGKPKITTNMWDAAVYANVDMEYAVRCQSCDCEVRSDILEDAIDGWNRRVKE